MDIGDDILGWIIIKGRVTLKELETKFNIERNELSLILKKFIDEKIIRIRKNFLRGQIVEFLENSPEGKKKKKDLMPNIYITEDKKRFQTHLDLILKIVKKYKKVEVSDLARLFKKSESIIESWGRTLERENLIVVKYPPFGKAIFLDKSESSKDKK